MIPLSLERCLPAPEREKGLPLLPVSMCVDGLVYKKSGMNVESIQQKSIRLDHIP